MRRDLQREAAIVAAYRAGSTYAEIGAAHGVCRERVRQLLRQAGEPGRRRRLDSARMVALYVSGMTGAQVAAEMGCAMNSVYLATKTAGVSRRPGTRP